MYIYPKREQESKQIHNTNNSRVVAFMSCFDGNDMRISFKNCWLVVSTPFEKYARQIGSFPQVSGWKLKAFETTTQFEVIHYWPRFQVSSDMVRWGQKLAGWWFQPIWKICSSKWIISPGIGVKIKSIWNHYPVWGYSLLTSNSSIVRYGQMRSKVGWLVVSTHLKNMLVKMGIFP